MRRELTCRWCGATGPSEEFELDTEHKRGFWCPDCDGFTAYSPSDNLRHRMLLLLEQHGTKNEEPPFTLSEMPRTALRKRVSPLRYPGGKSKLIDYLYARLQPENLSTFVEVFAGGASLGLSLLDAGLIQKLVLNDVDPLVYAFWDTALRKPDVLLSRVELEPPTLARFWEAKQIIAYPDRVSQEDLAWAFFLLNRTCYSGILRANPLGGRNGSDAQLRQRWNQETLTARLRRVAELAAHVDLYRMDCCDFLEGYAYWYPEATLFVDPPYVQKGEALYSSAFCEDDHERLSWMLESLYTQMPGPDIIITYDDCRFIRELYPLANVERISRCYSCATSGKSCG